MYTNRYQRDLLYMQTGRLEIISYVIMSYYYIFNILCLTMKNLDFILFMDYSRQAANACVSCTEFYAMLCVQSKYQMRSYV